MQNFLIVIGCAVLIFLIMMLSVYLAKRNKGVSGCCGGGHCSTGASTSPQDHECCGKHEH